MSKFLIDLFEKNKDKKTVSREAYGAFAGVVGLVCNILLSIFKIAAGLISGSIAITADGFNNLTDAASSIVTLAGFKMAQKPADKEHPYGHARVEYMAGMFIAVVIILVGVELLKASVQKVIEPSAIDFSVETIIILVVSILIKWWMTSFYHYTGKLIGSTTLFVAASDSRNDVITTSVVLLGALIQRFTGVMLDGWFGCAVAVFIVVSGFMSIRETMSPLLGEAPPHELVKNIYDHIIKYDEVLGVHDLLVHSYGPGRSFATVHIEMDAAADPMVSHGVIDNIEREVEEYTGVKLVGHMDPIAPHDHKIEKLTEQITGIVQEIDPEIGIHDLRVSRTHDHTNVIFDVGVPPGYEGTTDQLEKEITTAVRTLNNRYYPVIQIDRNYVPPGDEDEDDV